MKATAKKQPDPEKVITTMRLPKDLVEALDVAAEDDGRARSAMVIKILKDWVKKNGYAK